MESDKPLAQVQLKSDFTKTFLVPSSGPRGPLAPSSLRIQTAVLGLSVNNQSYAIGGSMLGWWDVFPTPVDLPAPYNDRSLYGILGGWGYARVLESTVEGVRPGRLVRGFLPLSAVPVDLQLEPAASGAVAGHYVETSPHRAKVMALYQRYVVQDVLSLDSEKDLERMAREATVGAVWECSYLLNRYTFAVDDETPMNPAGNDLPWTREQADIGAATVICLAASSKTSMALAWELNHRQGPDSGPFAIVGVTSPANVDFVRESGLYSAVLTYDGARANGARALVASLNINTKRIVMLDFGAKDQFTTGVVADLRALGPSYLPPLTAIRVGFEAKPYSPNELSEVFQAGAQLDLVQTNTSPLRDQALRAVGEPRYFAELEAAKQTFFDNGGGVPGLQISWAKGMSGPDGLEGAWDALCKGRIDPRQGVVVRL